MHGQATLAGDEVRIDGVHALVGDGLEDARDGRGANGRALASGDLSGIRQRDGVVRGGRKLTGEDRETPAELDVRAQSRRGLWVNCRRIDGVSRRHAGEGHDHLVCHLQPDSILCLRGRRAEVRRQHQVRSAPEWIVAGDRLGAVHVHGRSRQVPVRQRIRKGRLIDDSASCHVEHECPGLRSLKLSATQQSPCLRRQRRMDGDHVGPNEQLTEPDQPSSSLRSLVLGEVGIGGQDAHFESGGPASDRLSDLAETDDAERLPEKLATRELAALPLPVADRRVGAGNVPQQCEHQGERVLRGRDRVAGRGIDDHDPSARGLLQVDAIHPDARDADDRQPRGSCREQLPVHARLRANDDRVPAATFGEQPKQLLARQPETHHGLVRLRQALDRGLRNRLNDQDSRHEDSESTAGSRRDRRWHNLAWLDPRGHPVDIQERGMTDG